MLAPCAGEARLEERHHNRASDEEEKDHKDTAEPRAFSALIRRHKLIAQCARSFDDIAVMFILPALARDVEWSELCPHGQVCIALLVATHFPLAIAAALALHSWWGVSSAQRSNARQLRHRRQTASGRHSAAVKCEGLYVIKADALRLGSRDWRSCGNCCHCNAEDSKGARAHGGGGLGGGSAIPPRCRTTLPDLRSGLLTFRA